MPALKINWGAVATIARVGLLVGVEFLPPGVRGGVTAALKELDKESKRQGLTREELLARLDAEFPQAGLGPVGQALADDIAHFAKPAKEQ